MQHYIIISSSIPQVLSLQHYMGEFRSTSLSLSVAILLFPLDIIALQFFGTTALPHVIATTSTTPLLTAAFVPRGE